MKTKNSYTRPTIRVVDMKVSQMMLAGSATLQGYEFVENSENDGWQQFFMNNEVLGMP